VANRLRYSEVDIKDALEQFTALRRGNVRLWQGLSPADLVRVGLHSERGEESLERLRLLYAAARSVASPPVGADSRVGATCGGLELGIRNSEFANSRTAFQISKFLFLNSQCR